MRRELLRQLQSRVHRADSQRAWFRLRWPREVEPEHALAFLEGLAALSGRGGFVLEIHSTREHIEHRIAVSSALARAVEAGTHAIPGLALATLTRQEPRLDRAWSLRLTNRRRPIRTDSPKAANQALLASLSRLQPGEAVVVQWLLGNRLSPVAVPNQLKRSSLWPESLRILSTPLPEASAVDTEVRNALRSKQSLPGWRASLRIGVQASTKARQVILLRQVASAIRTTDAPGVRWFVRSTHAQTVAAVSRPWRWPLSVNVRELLGAVGWPMGDGSFAKVDRIRHTSLAPVDAVARKGRVIADSDTSGRALCLNPRDALQHMHVVGPTGVGKSTLLLNLVVQDMNAGCSVVVIEPKGDLITQVLERVPEHRIDDVVHIDPLDEAPVGLNSLQAKKQAPELVADQLLDVFHSLYADHWGPRTQDILHACLLTLASTPGMTLAALPLLLTNAAFRRRLVAKLSDPLGLGSFWSWYESVSDAERMAAIAPVMNKLRAFLMRPPLRGVVGQAEPRFEMNDAFTKQRIVLVNLARGRLGPDTAALLGSLVVAQLWQATLGRGSIAPEKRHPVFVYVDEFQDYLHLPTDLADALALSRSLGVGWIVAHQHMAQLAGPMRAAVLANARSRVCFQLGQEDATGFARGERYLKPEDFRGLGAFEVYASLLAEGSKTPWASGKTRPAPPKLREASTVAARSREQWGTPRADIEAGIRALIAQPADTEAIGSRPRIRKGGAA